MADLKACKKYADCAWRKSVGYCPENCNHFKHKDEVIVTRCEQCKHWGGIAFGNVCKRWSAPLAGMKNCTTPNDFCSYGERRDNG